MNISVKCSSKMVQGSTAGELHRAAIGGPQSALREGLLFGCANPRKLQRTLQSDSDT